MLHILFSLVDVRKVGSIIQCDPFRFADMIKKGLHRHILSFIFGSIDQQRWSLDLLQKWQRCPVPEYPRAIELARPVPKQVSPLHVNLPRP